MLSLCDCRNSATPHVMVQPCGIPCSRQSRTWRKRLGTVESSETAENAQIMAEWSCPCSTEKTKWLAMMGKLNSIAD